MTYAATAAADPASMICGVTPGAERMRVVLPVAMPVTNMTTLVAGSPALMAVAATFAVRMVSAVLRKTSSRTDASKA